MEKIKTGTTTVGIICKDGVVLAADKRTTGGHLIVRKESEKITQVDDNMAVTTAGTVSDIQMFVKLLKAELKLRNMRNGRKNTVKETANYSSRIMYENARQYFPSMAAALLGGYDATGPRLFEIDADGAMIEFRDYFSTGSGSMIALGVLENGYKESMTIKEGEDLALRAVNAAIQRDNASGNGIDVVVISRDGVKKTMQKKVSNALI